MLFILAKLKLLISNYRRMKTENTFIKFKLFIFVIYRSYFKFWKEEIFQKD